MKDGNTPKRRVSEDGRPCCGSKELGQLPTQLSASDQQTLQGIATQDGPGAAQAQAWLRLLDQPTPEVVVLPTKAKRLKPERERYNAVAQPILAAYPNPSKGPVYVTYTVVEGVEQAELQLHDTQGRLTLVKRLAPSNGIVELSKSELPEGVNIASLLFDGIVVGAAKLNSVR
jgi:hypothetical protein